ncbi:hypothetical protein H0H87_012792 [Tephrocybe sp. NHM501043]|nr:hypothetical protein H0H87_012792 [Tephrocybe sp. NHM501043]
MKFTSAFIVAAALPLAPCFAATITLLGVSPTTTATTPTVSLPQPEYTIYPIGTGSNGETTYGFDSVESVYIEAQLNGGFYTTNGVVTTHEVVTHTITTDPITYHATIVADATHLIYEQDPVPTGVELQQGGVKEECFFEGKTGHCIEQFWQGTETFTETTTFSGNVVPAYTIVVPDAAVTTSKGNGAVQGLGHSVVGWGVCLVASVSAWVLLL